MRKIIIFSLIISGLVLSGCTDQASQLNQEEPTLTIKQEPSLNPKSSGLKTKVAEERASIMSDQVTVKLKKGEVVIKLFEEEAPKTVKNFLEKAGSSYYEDLIFHRVEDWVVQGGDPLGNGTGGGKIETELSKKPFKIGSVGVARGGDIKVSNDSQFFICTKDCSFLNEQYTIFGEVTKGMDVVNKIEIGDQILSITSLDK